MLDWRIDAYSYVREVKNTNENYLKNVDDQDVTTDTRFAVGKNSFCNVIKSIFSGDLTSPLSLSSIMPRESSLQMSEMTLKFFAIDNSP